ncbi:tonB-system energizer ExbB [Ursidibacter arcticus]
MNFKSLFFILSLLFSLNSVANTVPTATLPLDLSPQTLYENAHIVVKAVIWILIICSIITWTIFIFKTTQIVSALAKIKKSIALISPNQSFIEIKKNLRNQQKLNKLVDQIEQEINSSDNYYDRDLIERIEYRLLHQIKQMSQKMRYGISPLATIGSVAPFIGLFGTVWGIMNSFIGIAQTHTTDLYAVAPGIAEALFATALGLVAAIPAVIIYNLFIRYIQHYSDQLAYSSAILQLVIRREISQSIQGK